LLRSYDRRSISTRETLSEETVMAFGITIANLRHSAATPIGSGRLMRLLLRVEAWLDARATRRILHQLDDRALADIGLTRDDLERSDPATSWQGLLLSFQAESRNPHIR
jgi:uncharacterized protein YjiS (DUF1127 family)